MSEDSLSFLLKTVVIIIVKRERKKKMLKKGYLTHKQPLQERACRNRLVMKGAK